MEKDDEVHGPGNSYTTDFRQYDPRLGRWTGRDPIMKPWESPYAGFGNNPVVFADPSGLDGEDRAREYQKKHGGTLSKSENHKGRWWVDGGDEKGNSVLASKFDDRWYEKAGKWISRVSSKVGHAISTAATIFGVLSGWTAFDQQMKKWGEGDDERWKGHSLYNPAGSKVTYSNGGGIENQNPNGSSDNAASTSGVVAKWADNVTDKTGINPGAATSAELENPYVNISTPWKKDLGTIGGIVDKFNYGSDVAEKLTEAYKEMKKENEAKAAMKKPSEPVLKTQTSAGVIHWIDVSVQNANGSIETIQVEDNKFNRDLQTKGESVLRSAIHGKIRR